jgi:hypothetical protein
MTKFVIKNNGDCADVIEAEVFVDVHGDFCIEIDGKRFMVITTNKTIIFCQNSWRMGYKLNGNDIDVKQLIENIKHGNRGSQCACSFYRGVCTCLLNNN